MQVGCLVIFNIPGSALVEMVSNPLIRCEKNVFNIIFSLMSRGVLSRDLLWRSRQSISLRNQLKRKTRLAKQMDSRYKHLRGDWNS